MKVPSMRRLLPNAALWLFMAQLLLMLVSWIYSAAYPASGVRSLLAAEGIRWFCAHFADIVATPLLSWLLLGSMAFGALRQSHMLSPQATRGASYRRGRALMLTFFVLLAYAAVIVLLAFVPHAILLSATGNLWPSPFSASLVPLLCFGVVLLSSVYGIMAGHFEHVGDVYHALLYGISSGAPLLLFYVLVIQIYDSLCYVLAQNPYF